MAGSGNGDFDQGDLFEGVQAPSLQDEIRPPTHVHSTAPAFSHIPIPDQSPAARSAPTVHVNVGYHQPGFSTGEEMSDNWNMQQAFLAFMNSQRTQGGGVNPARQEASRSQADNGPSITRELNEGARAEHVGPSNDDSKVSSQQLSNSQLASTAAAFMAGTGVPRQGTSVPSCGMPDFTLSTFSQNRNSARFLRNF